MHTNFKFVYIEDFVLFTATIESSQHKFEIFRNIEKDIGQETSRSSEVMNVVQYSKTGSSQHARLSHN